MIHLGDLFDVLPTLPAQSVHCVVTSPLYWGLRDYGNPPRVLGGVPDCEHEWGEMQRAAAANAVPGPNGQGGKNARGRNTTKVAGQFCQSCGAWFGCLGLEPTPELFVSHMVQAFAEVYRVLRDDGTLWLNIGDCYAAGGKGGGGSFIDERRDGSWKHRSSVNGWRAAPDGLKEKDLVGVPWMLAFALRAFGWYLRAEIVWAKGVSFCDAYAGSVMPESVQDRPTRSHEQVFLLTKSPRYFYDAEAVREQGVYPAGTIAAKGSGEREGNRRGTRKKDDDAPRIGASSRTQSGDFQDRVDAGYACYDGTRNLRTVWAITPKPFTEAHFATFPPDLVIPCIKAGTSEKGVCAICGAPWRRIVDKEPIPDDVQADFEAARQRSADDHGRNDGFTTRRPNFQRGRGATTWEQTCEHADAEIMPALVMDCFSGAGTVGAVCAGLQRFYVGIELNPDYIAIAERRIAAVAPLFAEQVVNE